MLDGNHQSSIINQSSEVRQEISKRRCNHKHNLFILFALLESSQNSIKAEIKNIKKGGGNVIEISISN